MFNQKEKQANEILESCIGKRGVWASNARYRWQCWTRDFVIAVLPLLLEKKIHLDVAKSHLSCMADRQKSSGQIPILFIENNPRWLHQKMMNTVNNKRFSFMLRKFFSLNGISQLTPWTKDSEILYCLGVAMYYRQTGDMLFWERHCPSVDLAIDYINSRLSYGGLVFGSDWRDTKPEFNRVMLLTNNCFLYEAYKQLGMSMEAKDLREKINKYFWTGTHYRDYIGTDRFDTLGNALTILYGIAPEENYKSILDEANKLSTPYGFKLNGVTLPPKDEAEKKLMERIEQDGVIWPFISGFMIMAFHKAGFTDQAKTDFAKWSQVSGFYEFYNPKTGEGHGSSDQLWSAMLYLRLAQLIQK